LFPDSAANAAEFARSGFLAQDIILTPKDGSGGLGICAGAESGPSGTRAAEMLDAVAASEALLTTKPAAVTVGGLTGLQMDVRLDPDWTGACPEDPQYPSDGDWQDARTRFIVLDVPGGKNEMIALGSAYSKDFEPFLAEAMPIIDTIEFEVAH
jgi:hypothetical protein